MLLESKLKYFVLMCLVVISVLTYLPYHYLNYSIQQQYVRAKNGDHIVTIPTWHGNSTEVEAKNTVPIETSLSAKLTTTGAVSISKTQQHDTSHSEDKPPITILIWGKAIMPGKIPDHRLCGAHSSVPRCIVTSDRTTFNQSEAVVFMMKAAKADDVPNPKWRKANQAYIWWTRESAWTSKYFYGKSLKDFDNFYNWTMTQRRDSDVSGMLIPFTSRTYFENTLNRQEARNDALKRDPNILKFDKNVEYKENKTHAAIKSHVIDIIGAKSGHVVWAASNCDLTKGGKARFKIVQSLQSKGLDVETFGKCGKKTLSRDKSAVYRTYQSYKFYLSFENSKTCRGYITEKLWFNAFYAGAVPVVWGPTRDDVTEIAPPNSFIHYDDFADETALIKYLDYLNKNATAYAEYFQWRWMAEEHYPLFGFNDADEYKNLFFSTFANAFCHLCKLLDDGVHLDYHKTIPSLFDHWYGKEHEQCLIK